MAYWILKTEPTTYSFARLAAEKTTTWDGVSNPVALKHMRSMAKGDQVCIYHTGKEKACVGLAEVAGAPGADPHDRSGRLVVVPLKAGKALAKPVTLAAIKATPSLKDHGLVRAGRLSVVPTTAAQWETLMRMAR